MANFFITPAEHIEFSEEKMKKVNLFESTRMFCDVYCLKPGQNQQDHLHADNDKIYHVLSGSCQVRIGDETRELAEGQLAVAPAGMLHGVTNHTERDATLLVVMAPHPSYKGKMD